MAEQTKNTRRSFLNQAIIGWFTITLLPVLYVVWEYLLPPKRDEDAAQQVSAGKASDLPLNSAKLIRFGRKPVMVLHTSQDQFKSFSATCTHLGCTVEYNKDDKKIHCNCHGSVFDLTGKNISGPAPAPLQPMRIILKDNDITISNI